MSNRARLHCLPLTKGAADPNVLLPPPIRFFHELQRAVCATQTLVKIPLTTRAAASCASCSQRLLGSLGEPLPCHPTHRKSSFTLCASGKLHHRILFLARIYISVVHLCLWGWARFTCACGCQASLSSSPFRSASLTGVTKHALHQLSDDLPRMFLLVLLFFRV